MNTPPEVELGEGDDDDELVGKVATVDMAKKVGTDGEGVCETL